MKYICKCINYYRTKVEAFFIMIDEKFKNNIRDKEYYLCPIIIGTFTV